MTSRSAARPHFIHPSPRHPERTENSSENTKILTLLSQSNKNSLILTHTQKLALLRRIFLLNPPNTRLPQGLRGQQEAWAPPLTDTCSVQSEQRYLKTRAVIGQRV